MKEHHEEMPGSVTSPRDAVFSGVAERLARRYAGADGPLSHAQVAEAVHDAADSLRGAPVQVFVPLIAENQARKRLQAQVAGSRHR